MKLEIELKENFLYESRITTFPIEVKVTSEQPIEIAEKVDINVVTLSCIDNDDLIFGFSQNITGLPRKTIHVDKQNPVSIRLNAFDEEDQTELFENGVYQLRVRATVFEKLATGQFKLHELAQSIIVSID